MGGSDTVQEHTGVSNMFFLLHFCTLARKITLGGGGVERGWDTTGSEPEFLNIHWRLKSLLFMESCLFKGQSVQQGSQWL